MKNVNKLILGLLIPFAVTGCNLFKRKTTSTSFFSNSSEPSSVLSSSESVTYSSSKTPLNTPSNVHVDDQEYINWNVVPNCEKYIVNVNDHEMNTLYNKVSISSIIDDYVEYDKPTVLYISVMAKAYINDNSYLDSYWSSPINYLYTKVSPTPTYPEGSKENPSKIYTVADLRKINDHLDWHYVLMNNLNLYDKDKSEGYENFVPIGVFDVNGEPTVTPFTGSLNGVGHTIRNLNRTTKVPYNDKRNNLDYAYMGLFAIISGGEVCDLSIENVNYTFDNSLENRNKSYLAIGGLAGLIEKQSHIDRVRVTGEINVGTHASASDNEQYEFIGGICGEASNSSFNHVTSQTNIDSIYRYCSIGGIIGIVSGDGVAVRCSYSIGSYSVISSNYNSQRTAYIGGIIGRVNEANGIIAKVEYCYAVMLYALVKGGYQKSIGGIIAYCTESNINIHVNNNYFYLNGKYDNGSESEYQEYQDEIDVNHKAANGNFFTPTQFKSGNTIGELHPYNIDIFDGGKQSTYCWIYEENHYPSLYWE